MFHVSGLDIDNNRIYNYYEKCYNRSIKKKRMHGLQEMYAGSNIQSEKNCNKDV